MEEGHEMIYVVYASYFVDPDDDTAITYNVIASRSKDVAQRLARAGNEARDEYNRRYRTFDKENPVPQYPRRSSAGKCYVCGKVGEDRSLSDGKWKALTDAYSKEYAEREKKKTLALREASIAWKDVDPAAVSDGEWRTSVDYDIVELELIP